MKKFLSYIVFIFFFIPIQVFAAKESKNRHKLAVNHIELLFFQQAAAGAIAPSSAKKGCLDLKLYGPPTEIVYFSNYPNKLSGTIQFTPYLEMLEHNQVVDNIKPNGILTADVNGHKIHLVGTLSNARFKNKDFDYEFCPFHLEKQLVSAQLNNINLFVDPIHRWPP